MTPTPWPSSPPPVTCRCCWPSATTAPRCPRSPPASSWPLWPSPSSSPRPHTPTDQAWIETPFGHVKGEWPHLEKIRDPGELERELDQVRGDYNTVRLHAAIGYVTPEEEHTGRGDTIRQARRDGLTRARDARIAYRRTPPKTTP